MSKMFELGVLLGRIEEKLERIEESMWGQEKDETNKDD